MITTEKTAFVYGGKTANSTKVPVTVIYSDDKGENWTTCELDNIYNADYYYVKFLMLTMVLLYAVTLKAMTPMNHPEYIKHLTAEKAGKQ